MNARTANILRLDSIPAEDFIKSVTRSLETSPPTVLLPDRKLYDVKIEFKKNIEPKNDQESGPVTKYEIYMVMEDEPLQKSKDRYFVFVADRSEEENLKQVAFQVKEVLSKRKIDSNFRIDPQQGLVVGSNNDTISPYYAAPRPRICIILYLVSDISHPGIATYEYVDRKYRKDFIKIFKKINDSLPKRLPKIFDTDILGFKRRREYMVLRHTDIMAITKHLVEQGYKDIKLSVLYENLSQHELDNLAFDTVSASFLFSGQGKFFRTLDELLGDPNE